MAFKDLGDSSQEEKWGRKRAFGPGPILVRVMELVNCMGKALLDQTGIDFVKRVGERNGAIAITGWRSAILLIAIITHNNLAKFPMIRGSSQQETIIVVSEEVFLDRMWQES